MARHYVTSDDPFGNDLAALEQRADAITHGWILGREASARLALVNAAARKAMRMPLDAPAVLNSGLVVHPRDLGAMVAHRAEMITQQTRRTVMLRLRGHAGEHYRRHLFTSMPILHPSGEFLGYISYGHWIARPPSMSVTRLLRMLIDPTHEWGRVASVCFRHARRRVTVPCATCPSSVAPAPALSAGATAAQSVPPDGGCGG